MNRKKYVLRKKTTTSLNKFKIPVQWANYFSKKRQLIRFYQYYFFLNYSMPLINQSLLLKLYDNNIKTININSSFLSKNLALNSALFRSRIHLNIFNFFENSKIGITHTTKQSAISESKISEALLCNNYFVSSNKNMALFPIRQSYTLLLKSFFRTYLLMAKIIKNILTYTTLLVIFK